MNCAIDCKKTGIAAAAAFVVYNVMDFVLHGVLLAGVYQRPHYASLWNSQQVMAQRRLFGVLSYLIFVPIFAKIYAHGYEPDKPGLGQGLRYGLLAGLMLHGYHALMNYMVYPVSLKLALTWLAGGVFEFAVIGAVVGLVYKPARA